MAGQAANYRRQLDEKKLAQKLMSTVARDATRGVTMMYRLDVTKNRTWESKNREALFDKNVPPPVPKLVDGLLVLLPNKPPPVPPPNAEVVGFDPKPR
jgi:hypothetical protein